jgi:OmpA-OmpF porin, OOP family
MNLRLLIVVGAIAPAFALCTDVVAAERRADIVVAQAPPANVDTNKDKDKGPPPGKDRKPPAQKPGPQQHQQQPVQQQQLNKPPQQPVQQQQQQQLQKPAQQPAQPKQLNKPAQQPAQQQQLHKPPQQPAQQQQLQKPAQQQHLNKPPQQPAQQQQLRKPPQQPAQQQQLQKPAMQNAPAVQTQQAPAFAPGNRRLDQVRGARRETHEGNRTVIQEQNRTIIKQGGHTIIRHDDTDRFRIGARNVKVERRGNETVTIIVRPDGDQIITVTDANGRLLRRTRRDRNGRDFVLLDNRPRGPQNALGFILNLARPVVRIPRERYIVEADRADRDLLYATLIAPPIVDIERPYTLDEIRYTHALRERMPRIDLDTITFDTGSWEITPDQARMLEPIAQAMLRAIKHNENEIYMVEGHTDRVGSDDDNLSLSDRRAEAVAEILTQEFGIPPENLTTQGYGEQYPKIDTQGPERRNRRVTVFRATPLLTGKN